MTTALVPTEAAQLEELESVIERGVNAFVAVGNALMAIRDSRLYRQEHRTFEDYCQGRWGFSYQRAHQLVEAAQVSTVVEITNERQARELAPLLDRPEALKEAWAEASANGTPTAVNVREVVRGKTGRQPATPRVVRAIHDLYKATTETPLDELVSWKGNSRRLAREWASAQAYVTDVYAARDETIPRVLKGEIV